MQILVVLTPFQARQLDILKRTQRLNLKPTLIYHSLQNLSLLDPILQEHTKCISIEMGDIVFSNVIKSPIGEIKRIRSLIKSYLKNQIDPNIKGIEDNSCELIIGSEKNIFTQLLIKECEEQFSNFKLVGVEEGFGYYGKMEGTDNLKASIYNMLTPILLGFKYRYFRALGQHPKLTQVYVRFPDEVIKLNGVDYQEIPVFRNPTYFPKSEVLLLTSPLSEDGYCTLNEEIHGLKIILDEIRKKNLTLTVKQHPREKSSKLSSLLNEQDELVPAGISAEEMDFGKFKFIINFISSTIIEIYQTGLDMNKVLTVGFFDVRNPLAKKIVEKGHFINGYEITNKDVDLYFGSN